MNAALLFLALEALATPFEDLHRFPSHDAACLNCCFADASIKHLEQELCIEQKDLGIFLAETNSYSPLILYSAERRHLMRTLEEARRFRACWKALVFSRCGDNRLENIEKLRQLLGERDYAAGQMPVYPWWRARHRD